MGNRKARRIQSARSSYRHPALPVLLILLLALGLRLWGLGGKSLWMDEIFTVQKASMPLRGMMREILDHDAHPPLFQLVEWSVLQFGKGDGFARLASVLAGVAGVWLMMAIGRRLFSRRAGLMAGALAALSWFHVYYSQEARLYAMASTLVLAQFLLLLMIFERRGRAGWGLWTAYGAAALACLYTYVLCILSVGAFALLYLWRERRARVQWKHWFMVHAAAGVLFLPWLPYMSKQSRILAESLNRLGDAAGRPTFVELMNGIASWAVGPHAWEFMGTLGLVLAAGLLLIAVLALMRRENRLIAVPFLFILVGYLALPMPRAHEYDAKHLIFLQPMLLLALAGAWGVRLRKGKGLGLMPLAFMAVVQLNLYGLLIYYQRDYQKENWRGLAADVTAQLEPHDAILFNPDYVGFAFDYYAKTDAPRAGIGTYLAPENYMRTDFQRIWIVECRSPVARPVPEIDEILAGRGWFSHGGPYYPGAHGTLDVTMYKRTPPPQGATP